MKRYEIVKSRFMRVKWKCKRCPMENCTLLVLGRSVQYQPHISTNQRLRMIDNKTGLLNINYIHHSTNRSTIIEIIENDWKWLRWTKLVCSISTISTNQLRMIENYWEWLRMIENNWEWLRWLRTTLNHLQPIRAPAAWLGWRSPCFPVKYFYNNYNN